jgi:hypothetical protein
MIASGLEHVRMNSRLARAESKKRTHTGQNEEQRRDRREDRAHG